MQDEVIVAPDGPYTIQGVGGDKSNTVTFFCGGEEMLKFSDKGFWIHGKKVKQDDKEAESVYNAFKVWLTWQQLNRYNT